MTKRNLLTIKKKKKINQIRPKIFCFLRKIANCRHAGRTRTASVTLPQKSVCDGSGSPISRKGELWFRGVWIEVQPMSKCCCSPQHSGGCVWCGWVTSADAQTDWTQPREEQWEEQSHLEGKLGTAGQFQT